MNVRHSMPSPRIKLTLDFYKTDPVGQSTLVHRLAVYLVTLVFEPCPLRPILPQHLSHACEFLHTICLWWEKLLFFLLIYKIKIILKI